MPISFRLSEKHWIAKQGLGFSKNFSLTDSDDTSVAFEVLSKFGRSPELEAVLQYEEANWFRCFHHEVNPSVDVNIHVIGALKQAGYDKFHSSVQKALKFIRSKRKPGKYWLDKWHLSPYYTTAHFMIAAKGYDDESCHDAIQWILDTQKRDGAWGFSVAGQLQRKRHIAFRHLQSGKSIQALHFPNKLRRLDSGYPKTANHLILPCGSTNHCIVQKF